MNTLGLLFRRFFRSKLWVLLFLVACGRGCSCTRVIDTAKETRKIDGVKVKITAQKLETTTSYVLRNKPKSYAYGFEFKVKLPERTPVEHLCHIPTTEEGDVDEVLSTFQFSFSPDQKHFAVGYEHEVFNIYHLLDKGIPFTSHHYLEFGQEHIQFADIVWDSIPAPRTIAKELIQGKESMLHWHETEQLKKALQQQPIPCEFDFYLIDRFPSTLARDVLAKPRVRMLMDKSKDWESKAIEKALALLLDNQTDYKESSAIDLVQLIDNPITYQAADTVILKDWLLERNPSAKINDYLKHRLNNPTPPLNGLLFATLKARAIAAISLTPNGNKHRLPSASQVSQAFDALIDMKETASFSSAITHIFNEGYYANHSIQLNITFIDKFDQLPEESKQIVLEQLPLQLNQISSLQKRNVLKFLKGKLSTKEYQQLEQAHAVQ